MEDSVDLEVSMEAVPLLAWTPLRTGHELGPDQGQPPQRRFKPLGGPAGLRLSDLLNPIKACGSPCAADIRNITCV